MKYLKTFEQFINESVETKEEKISKLKGKINDLRGDILNVPRGGGGAIAKKRMKAELSKAQAELTLLTLKENEVNEGRVKEWDDFDVHDVVKDFKRDNNNKNMDMDDINQWFDMFAQEHNIEDSIPSDYAADLRNALKAAGFKNADAKKLENPYESKETSNSTDVNEAAGTLKDKYEAIIKNLEKAKVPCRVKLTKDKVVVECGWDYPDKIADKVFDAADDSNLKDNEVDVCADHDGPGIIDTKRVNGGPKRY